MSSSEASPPKSLLVLGSTGSVGSSVIDVVLQYPGRYKVKTLVGGSNVQRLAKQAMMCNPENVAIYDDAQLPELLRILSNSHIKVYAGAASILSLACDAHDICISSISGIAGLEATMMAMKYSKVMAIANKESIVCAGPLLLKLASEYNTKIIPMDSEHNAIFQILEGTKEKGDVRTITLTASGGPLWETTAEEMSYATVERVLKHPKWSMGAKISVDSATMMNKGLELIEAAYLFNVDIDTLSVLVHPESIIHGLVQYIDGSSMAYCSTPDMRPHISYALSWPERLVLASTQFFNFADLGNIKFYHPDNIRFPLLPASVHAFKEGAFAVIAMNAANELAVQAFLEHRIVFEKIAKIVLYAVEKDWREFFVRNICSVPEILELHRGVIRVLKKEFGIDSKSTF
ncbi:1-deoxy-D-xylulose 5-phosphate reductoisomerase [Alphaproteobacteria bacterium]